MSDETKPEQPFWNPEEDRLISYEPKSFCLAIDFDGVIHKYSKGYHDGSIYDDPVPGAIDFIMQVMWKYKWSVFVMSTRPPEQIKQWFDNVIFGNSNQERGFKVTIIPDNVIRWDEKCNLGITNSKLQANVYLDDRAWTFDGSFTDLHLKLGSFKTWMNRE